VRTEVLGTVTATAVVATRAASRYATLRRDETFASELATLDLAPREPDHTLVIDVDITRFMDALLDGKHDDLRAHVHDPPVSPDVARDPHGATGGMKLIEGIEWEDGMAAVNAASTAADITWFFRDERTGLRNDANDWTYAVGDVARIRIRNDGDGMHPMQHPFHLHGQRFLVLARDGLATRDTELAWKDTTVIPAGQTVDILVPMTNPGHWMYHCHISEHLESGMLGTFSVVPEGGLEPRRTHTMH
jgi:FtsP/CotA-like multicopper oxidase with cupredoxin domain